LENESLFNKLTGELCNYLKLERAEFSWALVMVAVKYISNTQILATFILFRKLAISFPWRIVQRGRSVLQIKLRYPAAWSSSSVHSAP
jgi:hypothetical protein